VPRAKGAGGAITRLLLSAKEGRMADRTVAPSRRCRILRRFSVGQMRMWPIETSGLADRTAPTACPAPPSRPRPRCRPYGDTPPRGRAQGQRGPDRRASPDTRTRQAPACPKENDCHYRLLRATCRQGSVRVRVPLGEPLPPDSPKGTRSWDA
jgi:hypothetical protein